jgi:hypothetical protein
MSVIRPEIVILLPMLLLTVLPWIIGGWGGMAQPRGCTCSLLSLGRRTERIVAPSLCATFPSLPAPPRPVPHPLLCLPLPRRAHLACLLLRGRNHLLLQCPEHG